jgi:Carboxypeptidase regulatory-like domain/TonB-dependent Receptor Plug Domain
MLYLSEIDGVTNSVLLRSVPHRGADRRGFSLRIRLLALVVAVLAFGPMAVAQVSAGLSGTVTDPSGAAVTSAAVVVRDLHTEVQRDTATDFAGRYQLLALPVGEYEISVKKQGFAEEIRRGIQLAVGQDAIVDLRLQVGEVSQQITVEADVPPVSVTTADISGLVGEQQVKDLPLNGRSFDELVTLNPGVVNFTFEKTGGTGVSNSTNGNNFAVSGNRPQQNLFLLNGVEYTGAAENNMQPGGTSGQLLGVDAVREFNILRDTYGAAYGKRPGAQVSIITQSGTNQWHGSAYEFLRNNDLDARNFFDVGAAPPFQRNQFGASVGGPIQTDKTFVFANYEGLRQNLHQTSETFVPAADARNGTLVALGSSCSAAQRAACAAVVSQLLNLWPLANGPELSLPNGSPSGIAELFASPLQTIREDFGTARVDHVFSGKDTFGAVYTVDDGRDVTATPLDPFSTDIARLREQVLSLEETHVFSPKLVNTARFGYSRAAYFFLGEPTPGTPAASVISFVGGLPTGAVVVGGSTASNPATQLGLAGSNNGTNLNVFRNLYTYEDQVSLTRGRHQFSFGAWFQQFQSNEKLALSQYGQASFASINALLGGLVGTFTYDPAPTQMNWRSLFAAWYAEDTIRLTRNLTLSLGFRAESSTGWNEAHSRAANYFFTNGLINSTPHVGNSAFSVNNSKFLPEPRLGVAWSPFGTKTVVRAGFGMYNELQDALGYRMDQNAPFNPTYAISSLPVANLPEPISPVPAGAKLAPGGVQPNLKPPTLISYSLRVEQELTPNTSLTVGYVGSHGYHEVIGLDANEPTPVICPTSPCPATFPANFGALTGTPVPAGTYYTPAACSASVPSCNFNLVGTWTWFGLGTSSYNALEVDLTHRFSRGLSLRGVYTWSKALDDGDSLNSTTANNAPGLVSNPFNLRADKGLATFNAQNVAVISVVYELPFGRGKAFASGVEGWSDRLVSGWSVNSIITAQSGLPFTPQLSYNPSRNGDTKNPVRPFLNPAFAGPVVLGKPDEWFNPAAFIAPPNNSGFYGNALRDTLIGPGLATWDFSVMKNIALHEGLNLQFRAEMFNLLNRANFNTPNLILAVLPPGATIPQANPDAGAITSTSTTSRQVQFGLKLLW